MKQQIFNMPRQQVGRIIKLGVTLGLLISLVVTAVSYAQSGGDYDLDWSTIDNGGRYSAGGVFWLGGAVGQPDAGKLAGGDFELTGGFWYIKTQYPTIVRLLSLGTRLSSFTWATLVVLLLITTSWQWHIKSQPKR